MKPEEIVGSIILASLAVYFLIQMEESNTVIGVLKWGFTLLITVIQMVGITLRARRG